MAFLHSPPMSDYGVTVDIVSWLSDVASNCTPSSTPANSACRRNRSHSAKESRAVNKLRRLQYQIFMDAALDEINPNYINRSRSEPIDFNGSTRSFPSTMSHPPMTPVQQGKKKGLSSHKGSSSSGQDRKQTENVYNVRMSLAEQGMWFENYDSYDKYPAFQAKIDKLVFRDRGSVMRTESVRKIKQWRRENAIEKESTYYATLEPQIIKGERMVPTLKRSLDGIIIEESKNFVEDRLHRQTDCLFANGVLPKRIEEYAGKILGLTNPKPDVVFGILKDRFPPPASAQLSGFVKNLIGVAPGLEHAFFGIEAKGPEASIEEAENQALRTGATLVNAFKQLVKAAQDPGQGEEQEGVDDKSFAFTCSWVPQMAKVHVHWHELQEDGSSVWQMNVLRYYLLDCDDHMENFRRDIYNILDWGIGSGRQTMLRDMVAKIATKDPQITCPEQL